jgi:hypothetical protein
MLAPVWPAPYRRVARRSPAAASSCGTMSDAARIPNRSPPRIAAARKSSATQKVVGKPGSHSVPTRRELP